MKAFITISNSKFNEEGFAYHFINTESLKRITELFTEFNDLEQIDTALCFSVSSEKKDTNAIICKITGIEKTDNGIKIFLEKKKNLEFSCSVINKRLFATQCRLGLRSEKNLFVMALNENDFNSVVYPEEKTKKYSNLTSKLSELKGANHWLEMLNELGDLSKFKYNLPELWDDYSFLDSYVVYPLSHLVKPGDKYGKREKYLPFFKIFIERVLELYPTKIDTLSVLAYFHYGNYIAPKSAHEKNDFDKAEGTFNLILQIDPNHITSYYRLAMLYQEYLEQIRFTSGIDRRPIYDKIVFYHEKVIELFEANRQTCSRNEYEYQSSLYNLIKFKQEYFLDFGRAFFEIKVFQNDISYMLTIEKGSEIDKTIEIAEKLQNEMGFNVNSPVPELLSEAKKNQIDIFYRVAVAYQAKAIYNNLIGNNEQVKISLELSNKYIKKTFDIFYERKKRNIPARKPNYLYKVQALNNYLLGNKEVAFESLKKGQSDSMFMLAELLFIDGNFNEAMDELNKIQRGDKLNMYEKAQKLKKRIDNVQSN